MYIYIYTYIHICIRIYMCMYVLVCMYIYTYTCMYTHSDGPGTEPVKWMSFKPKLEALQAWVCKGRALHGTFQLLGEPPRQSGRHISMKLSVTGVVCVCVDIHIYIYIICAHIFVYIYIYVDVCICTCAHLNTEQLLCKIYTFSARGTYQKTALLAASGLLLTDSLTSSFQYLYMTLCTISAQPSA